MIEEVVTIDPSIINKKRDIEKLSEFELRALLWSKILRVAEIAGGMRKDGKNTHDKYAYISAEQITTKVRSALIECRVMFIPEVVNVEKTEHLTAKENVTFCSRVTMNFHPIDCDTGFRDVPIVWVGEDTDRAKSLAQAITESHKRFLSKTLFISQPDDNDADGKGAVDIKRKTVKTKNMKVVFHHSPLEHQAKLDLFDRFSEEHGNNPDAWDEQTKIIFSKELKGHVVYDADTADALFDNVGTKTKDIPDRFRDLKPEPGRTAHL